MELLASKPDLNCEHIILGNFGIRFFAFWPFWNIKSSDYFGGFPKLEKQQNNRQ